MSAPVCGRCGGWYGEKDDDGWHCLVCGHILWRTESLPLIKNGNHVSHTPGSQYDRLDGVKPALKGPGSLAR